MHLLSSRQCFQRSRRIHPLSWASCSFLLFFFISLGSGRMKGAVFAARTPEEGDNMTAEKRVGFGCSREDVEVHQAPTPPLPSGIPTYTVEVVNVCMTGCTIADIHVSCGWFSSARLINPRVFRRLGYDDCLVNDGGGLPAGNSVIFQYANTYQYPLSVTSVSCDS